MRGRLRAHARHERRGQGVVPGDGERRRVRGVVGRRARVRAPADGRDTWTAWRASSDDVRDAIAMFVFFSMLFVVFLAVMLGMLAATAGGDAGLKGAKFYEGAVNVVGVMSASSPAASLVAAETVPSAFSWTAYWRIRASCVAVLVALLASKTASRAAKWVWSLRR